VRATLGTEGVTEAGENAERALELFPAESPWRVPCLLYLGVSMHLTGAPERAVPPLQAAARRGALAVPVIQVLALSQLCLIATEAADPATGLRLMAQAREQVTRCGLRDYPIVAMVYSASAMAFAGGGQVERAQADVADAKRLLLDLTDFVPWFEAQVRLVLARACARLDDRESARILLQEAEEAIERTPDALVLKRWLKESRASVTSAFAEGRGQEWALTKAEVRTLQYLPSHLAFREIGERIHLSPNTVKTQAQAIYRKLGASSRAEAVEKARTAGLLGEDPLDER
jgi:LuxR family maltose regulon positive regulatory protein